MFSSLVLESGEALVGDLIISSPFTGRPCLAYFTDDEEALLASAEKLSKLANVFTAPTVALLPESRC